MHALLKKLRGGDRRSLGRANAVAAEVSADPALIRHLFDGLAVDDPVIRMRCADAIEKVTLPRPDLLAPFRKTLFEIAGRTDQQEVRWHMALMLPRLKLTPRERALLLDILFDYLRDRSSIVKTCAMQALADLAARDPVLKSKVLPLLEELTEVGTPAMRARGRKLLTRLKKLQAKA
jgi:hypothetical protein